MLPVPALCPINLILSYKRKSFCGLSLELLYGQNSLTELNSEPEACVARRWLRGSGSEVAGTGTPYSQTQAGQGTARHGTLLSGGTWPSGSLCCFS